MILQGEGVYPKYVVCEVQTEPWAHAQGHECYLFCIKGSDWRTQQERLKTAMLAVEQEFTVYGDELERVEVLK